MMNFYVSSILATKVLNRQSSGVDYHRSGTGLRYREGEGVRIPIPDAGASLHIAVDNRGDQSPDQGQKEPINIRIAGRDSHAKAYLEWPIEACTILPRTLPRPQNSSTGAE